MIRNLSHVGKIMGLLLVGVLLSGAACRNRAGKVKRADGPPPGTFGTYDEFVLGDTYKAFEGIQTWYLESGKEKAAVQYHLQNFIKGRARKFKIADLVLVQPDFPFHGHQCFAEALQIEGNARARFACDGVIRKELQLTGSDDPWVVRVGPIAARIHHIDVNPDNVGPACGVVVFYLVVDAPPNYEEAILMTERLAKLSGFPNVTLSFRKAEGYPPPSSGVFIGDDDKVPTGAYIRVCGIRAGERAACSTGRH